MAAVGIAVVVHSVVAMLLLTRPISSPHIETSVIDVALLIADVAPPDTVEDIETREPEPEPESEPDVFETELPANDDIRPSNDTTPTQQPAVSAQSTSSDVAPTDAPPENAYTLAPGTRSVLAGLQCPGDPEVFQLTGTCPESGRRSTMVVAGTESASDWYAIDVGTIRAMYGIAPHALSGQPTLATGIGNPTYGNADSMRDRLPSSSPDPAFGD